MIAHSEKREGESMKEEEEKSKSCCKLAKEERETERYEINLIISREQPSLLSIRHKIRLEEVVT